MKRILGIDPGSRFCGYGIVDWVPFAKPRYIECGVLQLHPNQALPQRLLQLALDLREIFQELKPDEVALESIFVGKNAQSTFRLGYARGVVMLVCAEMQTALYEYPPATVKRAVAGHGRATKAEMIRMAAWQCGLRTTPAADAADALAVALCHAFRQQMVSVSGSTKDGKK